MDAPVAQMRKGLLEFCVLSLLSSRPRYGYELVGELAKSDGLLTSEGTIYPLLSRLRRERLVDTEWRESTGGPPRKYYRVTASGHRALVSFREEWKSLRDAVDGIVKGGVAK
jgi:PadR family transcriptional regulator PadR